MHRGRVSRTAACFSMHSSTIIKPACQHVLHLAYLSLCVSAQQMQTARIKRRIGWQREPVKLTALPPGGSIPIPQPPATRRPATCQGASPRPQRPKMSSWKPWQSTSPRRSEKADQGYNMVLVGEHKHNHGLVIGTGEPQVQGEPVPIHMLPSLNDPFWDGAW